MGQIDLSNIKPEESHGLREWAKILDLGEANIRTAIRKKKLQGQLVVKKNADGTDSSTTRYEITGQQIIDWRNSQVTRSSAGSVRAPKDTMSYRVALKAEQATEVQAFLAEHFPGVELKAPKPRVKAGASNDMEEVPDDVVAEVAAIAATPEPPTPPTPPAQKRGLFG